MLAMRPDKFENLEKVTLTMDEPESDAWRRRAANVFQKTTQLCKEADVELGLATVEANYESTFFEYWGLEHAWKDLQSKDGKYVREEKRPKTVEEYKRNMTLEQQGTYDIFRYDFLYL